MKAAHETTQHTLHNRKSQTTASLEFAKKKLVKVKAAAAIVPEYIRDIEGEIKGKEYDNREEFGKELILLAKGVSSSKLSGDDSIDYIATMNGFDIGAKAGYTMMGGKDVRLVLRIPEVDTVEFPVDDESSGSGMVSKLVNELNRLGRRVDETENSIQDNEAEMKRINKQIGAPFEYAQEMAEKIAEAAQLQEELVNEGKGEDKTKAETGLEGEVSLQVGKDDQRALGKKILREEQQFSELLDAWEQGRIRKDIPIVVGNTPEVLVKLGAKHLPIVISNNILQKTIYPEGVGTGKHIIPISELRKLTRELYEPIMVLKADHAGRLVIVTGMKDKGENVIVAIQIDTAHHRYEVQEIATVHGRGIGWIENRVKSGNLLYYDKTKSLNSAEIQRAYTSSQKMPNQSFKSLEWVQSIGLATAPEEAALMIQGLLNQSILSDADIVKPLFDEDEDTSLQQGQHTFNLSPEQLQTALNGALSIAAEGSRLELKNEITIGAEQMKQALQSWNNGDMNMPISIKGLHRQARLDGNQMSSLIQLSLSNMDMTTPYHEAFHSVQELLLSENEMRILEAAYPDKGGIAGKERQAEAFGKYAAEMQGGRKAIIPRSVRTVFQKITAFVERVGNALRGMGFQNAGDIFKKAYAGGYKQRAGRLAGVSLQVKKTARGIAALRHENFNELSVADQEAVLKEARRQLEAVIVRRDEQGRLITETGKLSKLNKQQYKQVRTEWFKAWFGDWQVLNKPDMKITVLEDTVFSDKTWEAKQQAASWAKDNIRGEYKNNDTGWNIRVSKDGIQKITSGDRQHQKEHLEAIRVLPELLQNAVLAESHTDRDNNPDIKMVHRFYGALNVNNALHKVRLTVIELNNGNKLYDHSLAEIEKPVGISVRNTISGSAIHGSTTGSKISISNLLKGVKKNNGMLFDTSKVVDPETGEPMVVYHGTYTIFPKFDMRKSGMNYGRKRRDRGAFFTSDPEGAGYNNDYREDQASDADNIMAVFLNIRNPHVKELKGKVKLEGHWLTTDNPTTWYDNDTERIQDAARRDGRDGIIVRQVETPSIETLFAAFNPKQIKSATGNIGTFSQRQGDISLQADKSNIQRMAEAAMKNPEMDEIQNEGKKFLSIFDIEDLMGEKLYRKLGQSKSGDMPDIHSGITTPDMSTTTVTHNIPPSAGDVKGEGTPSFQIAEQTRPDVFLNNKTFMQHVKEVWSRLWPDNYQQMRETGDMKLLASTWSLPYWLAKKHTEWKQAVNIQESREEKRATLKHSFLQMSEAYMSLKDKSEIAKVEKALIDGNIEHKVWDKTELRERGLSDAGIAAYRSVRTTLDAIHGRWIDRAEAQLLDTYKGEKWYNLVDLIYGGELTADETAHLTSYLNRIKSTEKAPLEYVRDLMKTVFNTRALQPGDNRKLAQSFSRALKEMGRKLTKEERKALREDFRETYKQLSAELGPEERLLIAQRLRRFEERLKSKLPVEESLKLSKTFAEHYAKLSKQVNELKGIVRALNPELNEEQGNEAVRGLVAAYSQIAAGMKELKLLRSEMGKQVGYFPEHHGDGRYYVSVKDPGGETVYFRKVRGKFEAKQLIESVKSYPAWEGFKTNAGELTKELESTYAGLSDINTQRVIDNAIQSLRATGDISEWAMKDIRKSLLTTISAELKTRGFAVHALKRNPNLILGFQETDLKGVLGDYITGYAGIETKQDSAREFFELLGGIDRNKPRLFSELSHYAETMLRNDERIDRIIGKAKGIAFAWFLTGNLKSAAVQFTQNFVTGIPILSRRVGGKSLRAELIYGKAMKDAATGNVTALEGRMLEEMLNKGIADDQFIQQIMRDTKGAFSNATQRVMDVLALPFSHMEKFNRKSAALAMFRVEFEANTKKGMTEEEAYKDAFAKAKAFVYDTHYLMTKANDPRWARGGDIASQGAKLAYTFRKFNHNFLLSMMHFSKGPEGKLRLDVMARSLAYLAIFGGAAGLPFLDDILDELEKLTGIPFRTKMRNALKGIGGELLAKFGMAGLPALIGVDLSGSMKIGLPGAGGASQNIYGVYSGLYQKGQRAIDAVMKGEHLRAIENAAPVFLENPLKAYRTATEGATMPSGKVLFDGHGKPVKLNPAEAIGQGLGFRPERIAAMSQENRTYKHTEHYYKEKRDDLFTQFRLADTPAEREVVKKQVMKYNLEVMKFRGGVPRITSDSLRNSLRQRPDKRRLRYQQGIEAE